MNRPTYTAEDLPLHPLPADVTAESIAAELRDVDPAGAHEHIDRAGDPHSAIAYAWAAELEARWGLTPDDAVHVAVAFYFG